MRILLHVGMPKAGSTALQLALAGGRDRLARQGILYPKAPLFPDSQNFLIAGVEERRHALPRMIRTAYTGRMEEIEPAFARWMAEIRASVASTRPETMILSSEWLFGLRGRRKFDGLAAILRDYGEVLDVVAYVRRPADQYLSAVQQTLKGSHAIRPLAPIRYRTPLEGFARVADALHVVRYDRAAFPGGDIVRHFVESFLPEAGPAEASGELANATISAEGMAILAGYRRINHRKRRGRFTPDTDRLIVAIREADAAVGGAVRPRLRPEVARAIDAASEDVLWLREAHGIAFEGLDYDGIVSEPSATGEPKRKGKGKAKTRPKQIEEICVVDPERHHELTMRVLHSLATPPRAAPPVGLRSVNRWLRGREARVRR